jgi:hypothetical protein
VLEPQQRGLPDDADNAWRSAPRITPSVPETGPKDLLAKHRLVAAASTLAEQLLGGMGTRWQHTRGVAARGLELAPAVPAAERPLLVAAAWLHDIGYAEPARQSGFHPLDGARYLTRHTWDDLLSGLVAHHSGARFIAAVRGLDTQLLTYGDARCWTGRLADALTAADQTTGPDGRRMDVDTRLEDMLRRHGPDSPQARVHDLRAPVVRAAVANTERRLRAVRLADAAG